MTNGYYARNLSNLLNSQSNSPANIISPPILIIIDKHVSTQYAVITEWLYTKFRSLVHALDSIKQEL